MKIEKECDFTNNWIRSLCLTNDLYVFESNDCLLDFLGELASLHKNFSEKFCISLN